MDLHNWHMQAESIGGELNLYAMHYTHIWSSDYAVYPYMVICPHIWSYAPIYGLMQAESLGGELNLADAMMVRARVAGQDCWTSIIGMSAHRAHLGGMHA